MLACLPASDLDDYSRNPEPGADSELSAEPPGDMPPRDAAPPEVEASPLEPEGAAVAEAPAGEVPPEAVPPEPSEAEVPQATLDEETAADPPSSGTESAGSAEGESESESESEEGSQSEPDPVEEPPPGPFCEQGVLGPGDSSCYELSLGSSNWWSARDECAGRGASLARVDDFAEDDFIASLTDQNVWLGASDTQGDGVMRWTDGEAVAFGNWGFGQPDQPPGSNCIEKRLLTDGLWYDQPCADAKLYVCERPAQIR